MNLIGIYHCPNCEYYEGSLLRVKKHTYKCTGCNETWFIKCEVKHET